MEKYVDLYTDFGFKKIFGEEANKSFLVDFLNALLPPEARVKDLTFKNTEQLGVSSDDRKAVFDIYCENESGGKFIVEMQKVNQAYFMDRTIFYSMYAIRDQAVKGVGWDYKLSPVYCICILDFEIMDYTDGSIPREVVQTFTFKNQHNRPGYKKLTYIYLEMPNFTLQESQLKTRLDKWLFFIKNLETFQSIPEVFRNEIVFIEALEKAELAKMSNEDQGRYDASLKAARDEFSKMETKMMEGIKIGMEKGRQEGMEVGRDMGREEGKEQGMFEKAIEMAKSCLQNGLTITMTAMLTGLTEDEIRRTAN